MRTNGERKPDQILAEIDRTRGEMDRTLSEIEQRLTPGQLVDQGIDYLRHSGANEFVQNLGGAAKQNPMPVALVGIGLAWLMALGRQPAQRSYDYDYESSGSGIGQKMGSVKDKASGMMQSASDALSSTKERLTGTMSSVSGRAGEGMSSVRDRAGQVTDTARQQWERARGGVDYLVHEQPLALGAIGLAIGAILGAAAPRTRAEEQMIGDTARNLTEKAKEMGSQHLEKAKEVTKEVAEKAMGQSKPQGQQQQQQQSKPHVRAEAATQVRTPTTETVRSSGPGATGPDKKGGW
jgi:ElaB/YqjD/DUF883 family membrane-anchored ribosome-binding protein